MATATLNHHTSTSLSAKSISAKSISVVIPAFNEQETLAECHARLSRVMRRLVMSYELIFVNDGSTDATLVLLRSLQQHDPHVSIVDLSRNYGKEIALSAGLDVADGDAVIVIDADLQDPPELIPTLVAEWLHGHDVVYAKRIQRQGETFLKKLTARLFYRVIQRLAHVSVPADTGDFRLLSRRAVLALRALREQHRFMKGLFSWIGYPQTSVPYVRDARYAGETKWNYWKLWNFALEGITSFSTAPLRIATYIGLATALAALIYGGWAVIDTWLHGSSSSGYPSLITINLLLGGIELMAIGMIGEYLGRVFDESKRRPLYFINNYHPGQVLTDRATPVTNITTTSSLQPEAEISDVS